MVAIVVFLISLVLITLVEPPVALSEVGRAKVLAATVNDLLTSYIKVHNDVFKVSMNRIVPIPGVFEVIDFKQHVTTLRQLGDKLADVDQEIERWRNQGIQDDTVRTFVTKLQRYSLALSKAIEQFETISTHLYNKSKDPSHYKWKSYSKDIDIYETTIQDYFRLADDLNDSYRQLGLEAVQGKRSLNMDPAKYNPPKTIRYLTLLTTVFRFYREVSSQGELVACLGSDRVTDVSEVPEIRAMDAADPLPTGFLRRTYQFRDPKHGRGFLEAVFHNQSLVNVRAQLFLTGWLKGNKARKYLKKDLLPALKDMFGEPVEQGPDYSVFAASGLVAIARYVPGTNSVSIYIMDEQYA